ncbi:GNAT family N-acetyltransferase [Clostridium oryzae]|uniref:Acetyltransferase (GNAT) family protein n=1 Tax=Clostridium oryzae TaxID=1450648 RepID=A0A1V4ISB7_9CLOT|nr:GNAT family N-acetyltransferase [Clostridium oryzae]OPJ62931.1 acetyltransferase (GNAT) family protein [Clostridium oryzae]
MCLKIKLADKKDAEVIIGLLNEATLKLHKKGINQWEYPWNVETVQQDIESQHTYVTVQNDEIIGTFSIKSMNVKKWFRGGEQSLYLYRIAVAPWFQNKNIGKGMVQYALKFAKKRGQAICLDCWAGNSKLRSFYSDNGFRYVGDFPEEDYMISVFRGKI